MKIVAILASGVGERFGSNVPKQFHTVNGKMVIEYIIDAVISSELTDKIVIATNVEANSVYLADICAKCDIDLLEGGSTRNQSLKNVIDYVDNKYSCESLIVCDAVRPMITSALIDSYFEYLNDYSAVVTAQKITDSLGTYSFEQINREDYYLMQSPEGFDFRLLADNFDENSPLTEVTQQLPKGSKIKLYFDFNNNFKLTYPADLKYLEALIRDRDNNIDIENIVKNISRLKTLLEKYYPEQSRRWLKFANEELSKLLKKWQIESYEVIKTSHFGIIFIAKSIIYGDCVIKIIPPFIDRYEGERLCYQSINSSFMCELYDFDDACSSILLEKCENCDCSFGNMKDKIIAFFEKVVLSPVINSAEKFKDYEAILKAKLNERAFSYKSDLIMNYVERAVKEYDNVFSKDESVLIHGDLHRFNLVEKNGEIVAIDPIGYIAPKEVDIARYIGTELVEGGAELSKMVDAFSAFVDKNRLMSSLFIDMVFRLHNSLFENEDYTLTDKWLEIIEGIYG